MHENALYQKVRRWFYCLAFLVTQYDYGDSSGMHCASLQNLMRNYPAHINKMATYIYGFS